MRIGRLNFLVIFLLAFILFSNSCKNNIMQNFEDKVNPCLSKEDIADIYKEDVLKGTNWVEFKVNDKGFIFKIPDRYIFSQNGNDIYNFNPNGKKYLKRIMEEYKSEIDRCYPDNTINVKGVDTNSEARGETKAGNIAKFIKTYKVPEIHWYGKKEKENHIEIYIYFYK
ncbi:MAG: hypothetical protein DSY60_01060 [Persephonella sp.]|nr:MAG: hypothetical protein DSY60_01060 [Persephonella sp.]